VSLAKTFYPGPGLPRLRPGGPRQRAALSRRLQKAVDYERLVEDGAELIAGLTVVGGDGFIQSNGKSK